MQEDTLRRFMRLLGCEGARDWIQWDERICDWRTRKLPLTIHDLQLGIPTGIRPNKWETSWFTLDIDTHSPYHPRNDPNAIERMISLLSENGLETIPVLSSMSNGHHIWGPTPKIPTQALSKFLHQLLTFNNYIIRPGTLELFPNTRRNSRAKYNGIRLPLISQDSWILDRDLNPAHRDLSAFCDSWERLSEANGEFQTSPLVRLETEHTDHLGSPASRDAAARLAYGFTGRSQTHELARDAAFLGACQGIKGIALQRYMCRLVREAPNYRAWCRHQREIDQGIYPGWWKYYSGRANTYRGRTEGTESRRAVRDSNPEYNMQLSTSRRSELSCAVKDLKDSGQVFATRTAAIEAVVTHLRTATGTGMAKSTIYKRHLDLIDLLVFNERNVSQGSEQEAA